eukprot:m51a1_g13505 hypothetical protein (178) ;mRNA; r:363-1095
MEREAKLHILRARGYEEGGRLDKALEHYRLAHIILSQVARHAPLYSNAGQILHPLEAHIARIQAELRRQQQQQQQGGSSVVIPLTELLDRTKAQQQQQQTAREQQSAKTQEQPAPATQQQQQHEPQVEHAAPKPQLAQPALPEEPPGAHSHAPSRHSDSPDPPLSLSLSLSRSVAMQ